MNRRFSKEKERRRGKAPRVALPENTVFSLLVGKYPRYRSADFPDPRRIFAHTLHIKEFRRYGGRTGETGEPRQSEGGRPSRSGVAVVLGKTQPGMVIFPLADVQDHASPRPRLPLASPDLSYRHSFLPRRPHLILPTTSTDSCLVRTFSRDSPPLRVFNPLFSRSRSFTFTRSFNDFIHGRIFDRFRGFVRDPAEQLGLGRVLTAANEWRSFYSLYGSLYVKCAKCNVK